MELIDYLRMVGRRWRWVVLILIVAIGASCVWAFTAPKTYRATSVIFVGSVVADTKVSSDATQSASQFTLDRMVSYAALVTSPEVTAAVNKQLDLGLSDTQVAAKVSASVPAKTVLIKVRATDPSARRAADIANATATHLGAMIEELESPSTGTTPVKITVVQQAIPPSQPYSPNIRLRLALGALLGLGLGLIVASLRDQAQRERVVPPSREARRDSAIVHESIPS